MASTLGTGYVEQAQFLQGIYPISKYKEYNFRVIEAKNGWILGVGDKFWVYNRFQDLQEGLKGVLTEIELERTK